MRLLDILPLASQSIPNLNIKSEPQQYSDPRFAYFNHDLAQELNIKVDQHNESASFFAAQGIADSDAIVSQAYAGHQFGQFNPQLGDGRAHIVGDVKDVSGRHYELGFKGSGITPFSRGGDGKAALGPMLREVLIAEAMHALGVPTTRSLAVVTTGETVYRNPPQPGAVLTRLAGSHIRVGTFQFFAARGMTDELRELRDFCINRHYPELIGSTNKTLDFLTSVIERQAELIAQWMSIGFVHGVMNTDNMLISGETIDYGPCAFMDRYNPRAIYSSIDQNGRYAYSNQPGVAQWNLSRFAETLLPLIDEDKDKAVELATAAVKSFIPVYESAFRNRLSIKLGLSADATNEDIDSLIKDWLALLKKHRIDFTLAFRRLGQTLSGNFALEQLFNDSEELKPWLIRWQGLVAKETSELSLNHVNPAVIPRNHLVEDALDTASLTKKYEKFESLLKVLINPFETPKELIYMQPAPKGFDESHITFCGT